MRCSFMLATTAMLSLTLGAGRVLAQGSVRTQVIPEGQSASPTLTPGIRVGNMIYASGQLGMSRTAPDTTIQGQTRVALESTKKVFEAAGTTLANAVKCTVFLTDVKDFAGMNSVYREFFPVAPPARSTVVVAALVSPGAKVEIECAGVIP
jgi:2-iminobutanoate/2-iminopropanoate deaminase